MWDANEASVGFWAGNETSEHPINWVIWFVSGLSGATSADVVMAIVRQTNQADKAEKAADTGECVPSMRVGFCFLGFFLFFGGGFCLWARTSITAFNLSSCSWSEHQQDPDLCMNISAAGNHCGSHLLPNALNVPTLLISGPSRFLFPSATVTALLVYILEHESPSKASYSGAGVKDSQALHGFANHKLIHSFAFI